jgi:hypothetical protein
MKTTITRIHRWTVHSYGVTLACGHQRTVTKPDLEREQLFISKTVDCDECRNTAAALLFADRERRVLGPEGITADDFQTVIWPDDEDPKGEIQ